MFRNPTLASTWRRILSAAGEGTREQQIERARAAWSSGFVAEAIDRFCRTQELMGCERRASQRAAHGRRHGEVASHLRVATNVSLSRLDLSQDWTLGTGAVLLQTLSLLAGYDLSKLPATEPEFVHLVLEALNSRSPIARRITAIRISPRCLSMRC